MCGRVGEGRACWSLGNAYVLLGNHRQALHYARKHLAISREVSDVIILCSPAALIMNSFLSLCQIGDRNGELTAGMNVEELMEVVGVKDADLSPSEAEFKVQGKS